VTIDNLAIDIVRLAIDVWFQVFIVIEMKGPFIRLERWAEGEVRNTRQNTSQTFMAHIARREVSIHRE